MLTLSYLQSRYKDGARGETIDGVQYYDCWGLARQARHELCGKSLLHSRAGEYQNNPKGFTQRYKEQISEMIQVEQPENGVIIAVLRGRICIHVAVCIEINNNLYALETNPKQQSRLVKLERFLQDYKNQRVLYYD